MSVHRRGVEGRGARGALCVVVVAVGALVAASSLFASTASALCQYPPCSHPQLPSPTIGFSPGAPQPGQPIHFTGGWLNVPGSNYRWAWDFTNDGKFDDAFGETATWTFPTQGAFVVSLSVCSTTGGCSGATTTVIVGPPLASSGCPTSPLPFDLIWNQTTNGWPRDPEWAWQCAYTGRAFEGIVPSATSYCNGFQYGPIHPALDLGPQPCANQISGVDATTGAFQPTCLFSGPSQCYWNAICHFASWESGPFGIPIPTFDSDTTVHGHVNWMPVTYDGYVAWDDFSGFWPDDGDINLMLNTSALENMPTDPQPYVETPPGITGDNSNGAIGLEFNEPEVLARLGGAAGMALSDGLKTLTDNYAIVFGMLSLDVRHSGPSELHPVYAMAVDEAPDGQVNPSDDKWLIFARNGGSEGGCSTHSNEPVSTPGNQITFTLPPPGLLGARLLNITDNLASVGGATQSVASEGNRGALVTVTLPPPGPLLGDPASGGLVGGEVDLNWLQTKGILERNTRTHSPGAAAPHPPRSPAPFPTAPPVSAPSEDGGVNPEPEMVIASLARLFPSWLRHQSDPPWPPANPAGLIPPPRPHRGLCEILKPTLQDPNPRIQRMPLALALAKGLCGLGPVRIEGFHPRPPTRGPGS